jgi:hypothetical protein
MASTVRGPFQPVMGVAITVVGKASAAVKFR